MLSDPITLYKLMILYMLGHVNFPLTNAQLSDFFLGHEYTTYFSLQKALNELLEAGLIKAEASHNMSRYESTKEGEDTLSFFGKNISQAIVEDIDNYLKENRLRLRNEVDVTADYYRSTSQDYIVHCEVREGKSILIGLDVSVPDKEQAEIMCGHWRDRQPGDLRPCYEIAAGVLTLAFPLSLTPALFWELPLPCPSPDVIFSIKSQISSRPCFV